MRILFTSMSGIGHVQPMLPLAHELARRGHQLLWATAPDAHATLSEHGVATAAAGAPLVACVAEAWARHPEVYELRGDAMSEFLFGRLFGEVAAGQAIEQMAGVFEDFHPQVVVSDAGELTGPLLATVHGVGHATHGFGPPLPPARVQAAAQVMEPMWRSRGHQPAPFGGCYDNLYIDPYPRRLSGADLGHMPRVIPSRPTAGPALTAALPSGLDEVLAGDRPVVYLTFGTVFNDGPALHAAIDGLAAVDAEVVLTLGRVVAGGLSATPDNVRVFPFVPQQLLLGHCAAVVSHAGSGTVLGALAFGVAQLCLPQAADQFLNAAAVERAGAGLTLLQGAVTAGSVRSATQRLLDEPKFTTAARECAAEIATMPPIGDVADAVLSLAR